jgi:hypothetical protein
MTRKAHKNYAVLIHDLYTLCTRILIAKENADYLNDT